MKINDQYEIPFSFTQEQVEVFAQLTGDHNPIHLDKDYAAKSIFGTRIMHGFLSGSVFSRIIGMHLPGKGAIYLSQSLQFLKPMYVNTEYIAKVIVTESITDKDRFVLETTIVNAATKETTLKGNALIQYKG